MALRTWVRDNLFAPYKQLIASHEIQKYIAATTAPRLNVGGGGNRIPGWLNVDLKPPPRAVFMDASKAWPFPDGSLDAVLCEHMIEHVSKSLAIYILAEIYRTLAPGKWARVVTPDLNWLARRIIDIEASPAEVEYLQFTNRFFGRSDTSWCDAVNLCFYEHGHRYLWSIEELSSAMAKIGFQELTVTRAAYPTQPVFQGTEGHPRLIGAAVDALEAFAIEGRR